MAERITIEVALALPDEQALIALEVPVGTTVREALELSGMAERFPKVPIDTLAVGLFGKVIPDADTRVLEAGDRVELYRPLIADPKEARKRRAELAKARKEGGAD
ncbi:MULTISPECIES: RnfH family protein [unclassified Pseudomonas]|uniref:RnfH family protein n=1 Tax=unclassified Pseudomonas TaxID=196821 RepID=UPI000EFBCECF|nr:MULTISPECIES: RnfH family protein [unclassified Pseudomonas]AYN95914.1 RnfH family protein [Pseudomonas sp. LTJR-52]